ncbi:hypothetical protein CathTA2_1763 [Caldalkalibacillus thermarum TA2.A1]|uniref:Uncharacterized protein n=1 Tax=Caldalkalibacillus thermarum (strain TA2.A1) TaxID=986075 RepID=F5L7G3_CALTT|nr:hypothetical protein [Caldalkalibacillus thermarum]EGL82755.1 hypothetical protein CathTA2_1763 [Caldalkalibacillus thermarum TA2.A1]QZT32547.1 hypothetical protein HUR95_09015 [Caldalkalibacillus thermarum TA2.A1]
MESKKLEELKGYFGYLQEQSEQEFCKQVELELMLSNDILRFWNQLRD